MLVQVHGAYTILRQCLIISGPTTINCNYLIYNNINQMYHLVFLLVWYYCSNLFQELVCLLLAVSLCLGIRFLSIIVLIRLTLVENFHCHQTRRKLVYLRKDLLGSLWPLTRVVNFYRSIAVRYPCVQFACLLPLAIDFSCKTST